MGYRVFIRYLCFLFLVCFLSVTVHAQKQDWTHYVRTAGHGLSLNQIPSIVKDAKTTHLSGIEVDNDIPGRYRSFMNPDTKLKAIKAMADSAHAHQNHAFVYIAGLECITGNADSSTHSFFKDHPDWVQRNRKGQPALFSAKDAFWIQKGDEDVWISPYALQWEKLYMKRIRQIAATGIDGIYMDIPYWMTHFNGWEKTWASFDKYTVAAFKKKTGLDALTDFKLGDWDDPHFIAWVDFRIQSITDFIAAVNKNIKAVNPDCKLILEIFPGLNEAVPRVGTDNYQLSQVADVITHEYNPGGNSVKRTPLQWMQYMISMFTFRAFAEDKPTWMLSYSWDGDSLIQPSDAMKNLFVSQIMAGTNSWDAARFVMSGSNDYAVRKRVYHWIEQNENLIYAPRKPLSPIGVYFSPKTRNYFSHEWKQSYFGIMELLLLNHIDFKIVTPRRLQYFKKRLLIVPNVQCLSQAEISKFRKLLKNGVRIIFTGKTGYFDDERRPSDQKEDIKTLVKDYPSAHYMEHTPGIAFYNVMKKKYDSLTYQNKSPDYNNGELNNFVHTVKREYSPEILVENANGCVTQFASVHNKKTLFMVNYTGLKSKKNAIPIPKRNVVIKYHHIKDSSVSVTFIPFLGRPVKLKGRMKDNTLVVSLPTVFRGAIVQMNEQ